MPGWEGCSKAAVSTVLCKARPQGKSLCMGKKLNTFSMLGRELLFRSCFFPVVFFCYVFFAFSQNDSFLRSLSCIIRPVRKGAVQGRLFSPPRTSFSLPNYNFLIIMWI